jgi:hypothetical protein
MRVRILKINFKYAIDRVRNLDRLVHIGTDYEANDSGSTPGWNKKFSLVHSVQTGPWADPARA